MDLLVRHIAALFLALLAVGCASSSASSHRASSQDTGTLVVDASLVGAPAEPPAVTKTTVTKQEKEKVLTPPARPLLDVASLKARLRETSAIGTLAKLSLRSQMDELVEQLRAHHLSGLNIASMRAPYDALVLKVVGAVMEGDPSLARLITESREALWQLLADPLKFDSITWEIGRRPRFSRRA